VELHLLAPDWSMKVDESKAISRAFPQCLPERVRVGECRSRMDNDGHQRLRAQSGGGRNSSVMEQFEFRGRFAADSIEVPQQMAALFVMDGAEIDLITRDIAPLTDLYPKAADR